MDGGLLRCYSGTARRIPNLMNRQDEAASSSEEGFPPKETAVLQAGLPPLATAVAKDAKKEVHMIGDLTPERE